jgi:hypothetical protein
MSFGDRWRQFLDYIKAIATFRVLREDTIYSVRKFMAYTVTLIFAGSCVVTIMQNNGSLDVTQYGIIAAVILSYFGKEAFNKFSVTVKPKEENGNQK